MNESSINKILDLLDAWCLENQAYITEEDIDIYDEAHANLYNIGVRVKDRQINAILAKEVTC